MEGYLNVQADETACLSPAAGIVGDVVIGAQCSVFGGAQIRGDEDVVRIGARSNIQENCCLHTDRGFPLHVGTGVTVGHGAILHGCTVEDGCTIGMGAIVMDGARIGARSMVAAGALVTQGREFPPQSLIMGSPAKLARSLTDEEAERLCVAGASAYVEMGTAMVAAGVMFNPDGSFRGQTGA